MSVPLPSWILDEREKASIDRRRRLLRERAHRIHQPRNTSIAVDVSALEQQKKEKQEKEREEKKNTEEYEKLARNYEKLSLIEDMELRKENDAYREHLKRFWREEQSKEGRREFDLEQKGDSLYELKFVGEDEGMKEREKAQREQTRRVLQHQMREEKRLREIQEEREREEMRTQIALAERSQKLDEIERLCMKAEQKAVEKFNSELATSKCIALQIEHEEERALAEEHLRHAINSTFLTEDNRVSRSGLGPHRVLCDRWKGMSDEEKKSFREGLVKQIEENKIRRISDEKMEKEFEKQANSTDQNKLKFELESETRRKETVSDLVSANLYLSEKQQRQMKHSDNERRTNFVTDEFFNKFGIYPR